MCEILLEEIIRELPNLTLSELEELENRICFFKSTLRPSRVKLHTYEEDFYLSLMEYLSSEKGIKVAPFHQFQKSKSYDSYHKNFPVADLFTKTHFKGLNKTELTKLQLIYAELLCNDIESFTGTININIISNNVNRIPELFHKAFPGYIKAGLAKAILGIS